MMVGHLIVDNQHQVLHIQASGSNGCGHQHIADTCLEVIDGALPVRLGFGPVEGQTGIPHLQSMQQCQQTMTVVNLPVSLILGPMQSRQQCQQTL